MYWFVVVLLLWAIYRLNGPSSEQVPIFGVYRQEGFFFPFKMALMFLILKFRKIWSFVKFDNEINYADIKPEKGPGSTAAGYGTKSRSSDLLMDCPQELSTHPKAVDATYFNGANRHGWSLIGGLARRPQGVINGFLFIKVPGVGMLMSLKLPDTLLFQTESDVGFSAEGMKFEVFQPMVAWLIKYDGPMRIENVSSEKFKSGDIVHVKLNGMWTTSLPPFDFDTDMSPSAVSRCMAKEMWSRDYFKLLREFHQTHYEQFGELTASLEINEQRMNFTINAVRDHSYGDKREWKNLHRYALHWITLESGAHIAVHVISMPVIFSNIEMGYVYTAEKQLHPVDSTTFKLHEHGEGGNPPRDYAFSFNAGNETYHVKVEVLETKELFMGWEWEAKVIEAFCRFEVNGVLGWGAVEFEYRHLRGRPDSYSQNDPQWTHNIVKGYFSG